MNEIEEETTERLIHNLQVECLLASANCAKVNFDGYKTSWILATDLDVKKNAAEVLRAMFGKVEAIVNGVALEFERVLNAPNRETLEALRNWLASEVETANKAKAFLDRFEAVEASRKKIEAVCDRLGMTVRKLSQISPPVHRMTGGDFFVYRKNRCAHDIRPLQRHHIGSDTGISFLPQRGFDAVRFW